MYIRGNYRYFLVAVSDTAVISGFLGRVMLHNGYQRFYDDVAVYLIKTALKRKYRGIRWFDANFFSVGRERNHLL